MGGSHSQEMPLNLNVEEIGRIYLTQNPDNYFAEVEQVAFSPSNVVRSKYTQSSLAI
jgi:catalase